MSDPTSTQFAEVWQNAAKRYEEISGKKLADLDLKRLQNVDDLERSIDDKSKKIVEFREKRGTLFKVMRNAMLPVELVGKLAAGGASMAFPPSSLVFGAVSYLIGAAKDVSSAYDAIQDLMGTLQDFTVRLKVYNREKVSPELQTKLTEVLVALLEIFALSRRAIKRGRLLSFGRSIVLGQDKDIAGAVGKLEKLTRSEDQLVGAETHTEVRKQGRTLDGVATTVSSTHVAVEQQGAVITQMKVEQREMHEEVIEVVRRGLGDMALATNKSHALLLDEKEKTRHDKIKQVLQPSVNPQDVFDKIMKERVPGTGDWIRGEDLFKSWVDTNISVLWVSGIPGAGKSFLSSNMISFLKEQYPQGVQDAARISVGYFFFKDNNPEMRSFHQALRDLAFQISQNDPVYAKHLDTAFDSPNDIKTIESAWRKLFLEFFIENDNVDSTVYLVIDGVDEAYDAEREAFLTLLQDLKPDNTGASRIQLVMVGRPHLSDAISDALGAEVPTIHVTGVKNSEDIVSYIQSSIRKSRVLKRVSKRLQEDVVETLSSQANGMFLWVDLMIRELNTKSREPAIRDALKRAPRGLTEMLQHVLEGFSESLPEEDAADLNELLTWVTCAKRPLSLGELDTILRCKSPTGDGVIYLEGKLRKQYASFFVLNREDGLSTADLQNLQQGAPGYGDDAPDGDEEEPGLEDLESDFDSNLYTTEVTFCHTAISDFFRDQNQGKVRSSHGPAVGVDITAANSDTWRTLLMFLTEEDFEKNAQESVSIKDYATHNWLEHLRDTEVSKASADDKKLLGSLLVRVCREAAAVERWGSARDYTFWVDENILLFRKWFEDKEVLESLPPSDREWVRSTSDKPASTFVELAKMCARKWLQDVYYGPKACFWLVFRYLQYMNGTPLGDTSTTGVEGPHVIEETAEWAGFEKTALWHRRLAMALRDHSFFDAATIHFEKALELDPEMWLTRGGIALIHQYRDEHEKALQLFQENVQLMRKKLELDPSLLDSIKPTLTDNLKEIGSCYDSLGKRDQAYQAYREAWNTGTNVVLYDALDECFRYLHDEERYQDVMDLIKELDAKEIPGLDYHHLALYMEVNHEDDYHIIFHASRHAARETGELQYLADTVRDVISSRRKERRSTSAAMLELFLAKIYHLERINPERAVRIWEHIVGMVSTPKAETVMAYARRKAASMLARHHFAQAMETKGTSECNQHVRRLERLGKSRGRSGETINVSEPSIILGLWYRLNGQAEESKACFKAHIKQALQLLSDDDPSNDESAYFALAEVLLSAGDDEGTIGMYRTAGAKKEEAPAEEETGGEDTTAGAQIGDDKAVNGANPGIETDFKEAGGDKTIEDGVVSEAEGSGSAGSEEDSDDGCDDGSSDDDGDFAPWSCDGVCSRAQSLKRTDTFWLCRYCYDVGFCQDCLALVREDRLPTYQCSSRHEWLRVQPTDNTIPMGKVYVGQGDELVDLEDWKKELKRTWGV